MFTGLIEGQGTVRRIDYDGPAITLVVEVPPELAAEMNNDPSHLPARIGDSISINGCCLTIVAIDSKTDGADVEAGPTWSFQAGEETLSKTNLGNLNVGDRVNLERALSVGGRLGGHFVQGHVDGVGTVHQIDRDNEWVKIWFQLPAPLARQMVAKGSVTVDGISLTVVDVEPQRFSVALIPHTLDVTTLGSRNRGDRVNIETDILGKYVQRLLNPTTNPGDE